MTLPPSPRTGGPGWLTSWTAELRRRAIDLGRGRRRAAALGFAAGVVGGALAVVVLAAGHPYEKKLPTVAWALAALVLDALVLLACWQGWHRTVRIFAGNAPPPASMAGIRLRTALPGMAALLVSLIGVVFSALAPLAALSHGHAGWTEVLSLVAVVLALGCGAAPIWLWVNLLPVQQNRMILSAVDRPRRRPAR